MRSWGWGVVAVLPENVEAQGSHAGVENVLEQNVHGVLGANGAGAQLWGVRSGDRCVVSHLVRGRCNRGSSSAKTTRHDHSAKVGEEGPVQKTDVSLEIETGRRDGMLGFELETKEPTD